MVPSFFVIGLGALADDAQVVFAVDDGIHAVDLYGMERWKSAEAAMPVELGDGTVLAVGNKGDVGFPVVVLDGETGSKVGDCGSFEAPDWIGGHAEGLGTSLRISGRWHEGSYWMRWQATRVLVSGVEPTREQVDAFRREESGSLRCTPDEDGRWVATEVPERRLPELEPPPTPSTFRAGNGVVMKLREDNTVLWQLPMRNLAYTGPRPP